MKKREELDKLHEMATEDLQNEAVRLKESLFRLNFKLALGELDVVKNIRREKTSLARINTLVRKRQLDEASQ
jgi:large subunit ribosomal protein L29